MAEPEVVPKQIYDCMKGRFGHRSSGNQRAVEAGYRELRAFNQKMRDNPEKSLRGAPGRKALRLGAGASLPTGPGNRHEIEGDFRRHGYPISGCKSPHS